MGRALLIIDPQNSFCHPEGELFVEGADRDMERLSRFIQANGEAFGRIIVTLDSHNRMHIAHPAWWKDHQGNHPTPFTTLTRAKVKDGTWSASNPIDQAWSESYMDACPTHVIWPPHCLLGTWGHGVYAPLDATLTQWADHQTDLVLIPKGNARYTEHFSILQPKVRREGDPSACFNLNLLDELDTFDDIYVAGEASSHCIADSVRDIVHTRPAMAKKLILLIDAMSPVTGFATLAQTFLADMKKISVRFATTTEGIEQIK